MSFTKSEGTIAFLILQLFSSNDIFRSFEHLMLALSIPHKTTFIIDSFARKSLKSAAIRMQLCGTQCGYSMKL